MINVVVLRGNLGADPELRYAVGGKAVASLLGRGAAHRVHQTAA